VAIGKKVAYSLGDRVYTWPLDGTPGHAVPGTEGATSLTSYQGNLFVGTADGWLLCSQDDGNTVYPLADVQPTPLSVLGTDGAWLYAGSGNSTYMLNLKNGATSLCHPGFAAPVTNLTVLNGAEVLVGTQGKGLTWMPR